MLHSNNKLFVLYKFILYVYGSLNMNFVKKKTIGFQNVYVSRYFKFNFWPVLGTIASYVSTKWMSAAARDDLGCHLCVWYTRRSKLCTSLSSGGVHTTSFWIITRVGGWGGRLIAFARGATAAGQTDMFHYNEFIFTGRVVVVCKTHPKPSPSPHQLTGIPRGSPGPPFENFSKIIFSNTDRCTANDVCSRKCHVWRSGQLGEKYFDRSADKIIYQNLYKYMFSFLIFHTFLSTFYTA